MKTKLTFGKFGPNDAHGGRAMPACIGDTKVGEIQRVVEESFVTESLRARKLTVTGYKLDLCVAGFRTLGFSEQTVSHLLEKIDEKEYRTIAAAKDALRTAVLG